MMYTADEPRFRYGALTVFVVAALSDGLDGFVARAYNQKTRLGAALDPLADKLLLNLAFVFLAVNQEFATPVPKWVPVVVLSRDVFIASGSYILNEYYGPFRPRPRLSGKLTTAAQMAAITAVLLEWRIAYAMLMVAVGLSVLSFLDYFREGLRAAHGEEEA